MPLARGDLKFLYRMTRQTDRENGRLEEFKDGATGGDIIPGAGIHRVLSLFTTRHDGGGLV